MASSARLFAVYRTRLKVSGEVKSTWMLVDYLRDTLELRGTKYMCREGGCGACIVSVIKCPGGPVLAVNACMVPITSCHEWEITTIEHLGNRKKGYHILQKTLAEYNGTQCGHCSPAWVMNMYSFLQRDTKPTKLEIERAFGSNVCRCTGYRPILDAFKRFSIDDHLSGAIRDIEDLNICKKSGKICTKTCDDEDEWCILGANDVKEDNYIKIKLHDDRYWFKVTDLDDVFKIMSKVKNKNYMLVQGNTARGAYPIIENPNTLIDITAVPDLKYCEVDQNLQVGAGLTLTELEDIFNKTAEQDDNFKYLTKLVEHIQVVAHIPVRNQGTVGGNLMIKHQHNEFPSDLFLLFATVDAYVNILSSNKQNNRYSMKDFLKQNMKGKILTHIFLPPLSNKHKLETFKITPRFQNAHAILNAGFLYELTDDNNVKEATIVYGGLSPKFIRASATERFLMRKPLFNNATLQAALGILSNELIVEKNPPEPSVELRKKLAVALFYKGVLSLSPSSSIAPKYRTGSSKIHFIRPVSEAKQIFDTNPALWPLNQPIPKVDALIQCAGESKYTDDVPTQSCEVHAAFVLSTVTVGTIQKIDVSAALKHPGVIAFYGASDIPGVNSFTPGGTVFYLANEEVFCSGSVKYYNQPIGVIVAEDHHTAVLAAKMVCVTYTNTVKPTVFDIKEAIKDPKRLTLNTQTDATERATDIVKTIKGENTIYGQYHFAMENIVCVTRPTEEGLEIFSTTQWIDIIQWMVSQALKIPENRIDVYVRRLGGAFGMKISRPAQIAVACSLVTQKLNRPCRFVLPLTDAMRAIGKRLPCVSQYECSVNASGVIQYVDYKIYEDNGYFINETLTLLGTDMFNNCYSRTRWDYKVYDAITDTAKNTWCRSPGTLESISMAEILMERISYELSLDPFDVRLANLDETHNELRQMIEDLKTSANYNDRKTKVANYNAENKWKKRGLRVSLVRWTPFGGPKFVIHLSICHADGTVIVTHGGIEMGQGINTKAVQICAYYFKIPIEKVQVKANTSIITPNCFITGGSLASQSIGLGVRRACLAMLDRLEPIRKEMDNPSWEQLIDQAYYSNVDLHIRDYVGNTDTFSYHIYGVAIAEAEVDILTGEVEIKRVDLMQDCGQSVSPEVDVGQVEGAFVMGQGYWTSENLVYHSKTGELLTDRTWFYHVPLASDIPQVLNVNFRKKSYSFKEILGAKGTGEPPLCLSIVIAFAIRAAIVAARQDCGIPSTEWFNIDGPCNLENILLALKAKPTDYKLN